MRKGEDIITFVDESLYLSYAKSTWWIDSGATIHVVNYNLQPEKWDIEKPIAMCVQEEERLKSSHGDSVNHVKENKKNFNNKNAKTIRETLVEQ